MATSEVAVCNLALAAVGDSPITSMNPPDDTERARLCARFYAEFRDELLDEIKPNFAIARAALNRLVAPPAFGYAYQFDLPPDCLRVVTAETSGGDWRIEGRALLTNTDSVSIQYVVRVTDVTRFSPKFTAALVAYLASQMAYPLTKLVSLQDMRLKIYLRALDDAKDSEGAEGTPLTFSTTRLQDVR